MRLRWIAEVIRATRHDVCKRDTDGVLPARITLAPMATRRDRQNVRAATIIDPRLASLPLAEVPFLPVPHKLKDNICTYGVCSGVGLPVDVGCNVVYLSSRIILSVDMAQGVGREFIQAMAVDVALAIGIPAPTGLRVMEAAGTGAMVSARLGGIITGAEFVPVGVGPGVQMRAVARDVQVGQVDQAFSDRGADKDLIEYLLEMRRFFGTDIPTYTGHSEILAHWELPWRTCVLRRICCCCSVHLPHMAPLSCDSAKTTANPRYRDFSRWAKGLGTAWAR